jgi:hypothetical protein
MVLYLPVYFLCVFMHPLETFYVCVRQCFGSALTLSGSGSSFLGECGSGSSFENESGSWIYRSNSTLKTKIVMSCELCEYIFGNTCNAAEVTGTAPDR